MDSLWYGANTHSYHDAIANEYIYHRVKLRHFSETWYLWITLELKEHSSTPTPEDYLIVEYDGQAVSIAERIVEGKYTHLRYANNPASVPPGSEIEVKIYTVDDDIDNDAVVYPPYELDSVNTIVPLFDFISGTPTIGDWNDLTKAINNILDVQASVNPAFLATHWVNDLLEGFDFVRYSQKKHNDFVFVNYQVRWPERQPDPANPYEGSNYDIKFTVNDSKLFHHGVYLTRHQGTDVVHSSAQIYAEVGDKCKINGKTGIVAGITKVGEYDYEFDVTWDTTPPDIIQIMDAFEVWSPIEFYDIKVRKTELEGEYRPFTDYSTLVSLSGLVNQGDTYTMYVSARRTTPPDSIPKEGELIIGFIGEAADVITGAPVTGWSKMVEWKHLDPVPGTGDKAINNIVENIRMLQEVTIRQRAVTRRRTAIASQFDLCVNHRYRWLGIIVYPDDEGKLPDSKIVYHNGQEWVEENITYSEDNNSEKIEYIDLTEYPKIIDQGFYVLKNVNHAYELDFIAEV